jgi:UDP-N-acetylmuramoyl-tripeptide--D-alanyl-D-alanine ligase
MRLSENDVWEALRPSPGAQDAGVHDAGRFFTGVSTDTRTLRPGDLFVALISPQVDGHDYITQALAAGAAGVVVSQDVPAPEGLAVFQVPNTEVAYGQLARWWRDQFDVPVIGVTGSVGKTTVKEMLAAALSPLGPILKTAASQNNETGVPKALLQLTSEHRAAVIEMGMRGAGQIALLCGIARPTVGVITVISDNHIELLGSRDAIADAKGELLESLSGNGLAVLNADDPYLGRLRAKTAARVVTYSTQSRVFYGLSIAIASPSRHDYGNAMAALVVAEALGVAPAEAIEALKAYAPPPMRMEIGKTKWGGTVLNDAYNAAPASMKSALETLIGYGMGRKIAFLGDMKELGAESDRAHQELGTVIAELGGLDVLYAVGSLAAQIPGAAAYFPSSAEASAFAATELAVGAGDVILVKGSRAMMMEHVAEALVNRSLSHNNGEVGEQSR